MAPPYAGLRVVELAHDPAGELTGKLLAQYGATVVKVEPPEGAPSRRVGPFAGDHEDVETSLTYWLYNTTKRSVVLHDAAALEPLLAKADVAVLSGSIEEQARFGIEPAGVAERHPELVVCCITPFGLDGPWAHYRSSDLVSLAAGGLLNSCGYDDHSIPPIRPAENHAYHVAASFAHMGILLALLERDRTGQGQLLDTSVHESVAVSLELGNPYWFYPRALVRRQTCRHAQPSPTQPALFPTRDGRFVYFALILADVKPWQSLVAWMDSLGVAVDLVQPAYEELSYRQANFPHIQSVLEAFFLMQDADDIYHEGQARGLPIAVVNAPDEVLEDEHLRAREFFELVEHDGATPARYPGPPMRFSEFDAVSQRAAPRLGDTRVEDAW